MYVCMYAESQYQTASCVRQQWRVVAFVDITWNVEASSNLHKFVRFLSKLTQIQWINELKWVLELTVSELSCSGLYIWSIPGPRMGFYPR